MQTKEELYSPEPFDWNEFLSKENITYTDWNKANYLAGSWVTCACGNQCKIIPRGRFGVPKDPILYKLGLLFATSIFRKNISNAVESLKKIEIRSAEIINEIKQN